MAQETKTSILVVGGDSHFYYLMRHYILMSAHRVLYAHQGGLDVARQEKPIAIFMYVANSGAAALEILQELKSDPCTCKIPLAICSWLEEDEIFLAHGVDIILHMPILYEDFSSALARMGILPTGKRAIIDETLAGQVKSE